MGRPSSMTFSTRAIWRAGFATAHRPAQQQRWGFGFGNSPYLKWIPLLEDEVGANETGAGCITRWVGHSAALAGLLIMLPSCHLEQVQIGQFYTIRTAAIGACPMLDWTFVVDAQRHIAGHVSDSNAAVIARLSGTLDADDSYNMVATNLRDGHTADVNGRFTPGLVTLSVKAAGDPCDGQSFRIRFVRGPGLNGGGG